MNDQSSVPVRGEHENPTATFGKDASYRLEGDTVFGWRTAAITGDLDLNGHAFVMETGGGNRTVFSGALTGTGTFEWRGGGIPQVGPSILTGARPNTFSGTFTLAKGVLELDKPEGVPALSGDLVIGGKGDARVECQQAHQLRDTATVTFTGPGTSELDLQGHDQAVAGLVLQAHATVRLGAGVLRVQAESPRPWDLTKTLTFQSYQRGKSAVFAPKLTPAQLTRLGFALPDGLYTARRGKDGALLPDRPVRALNPPFDLSPRAVAERAKLYTVPRPTPLPPGVRIGFFGDSLTWLNGYIDALKGSATLINRGINGGGVLQLRDGVKEGAFPGSSPQAPFAQLLASDKLDIAVVFIGINDVWWRKTSPEAFTAGLRDLAAAAKAQKVRLVLATMTLHGELPEGKNPDDPKIEQYNTRIRAVASESGATLVDLRRAYLAYLQNKNAQLRVDGSLYSAPSGILTYDGVHPNAAGVSLLANLLGEGVYRAYRTGK